MIRIYHGDPENPAFSVILDLHQDIVNLLAFQNVSMTVRRLIKIFAAVTLVYLSLSTVAGIVLAEGSLRLWHRPLHHRVEAEAIVHREFQTELQEVSIAASDSVVLKGWYVRPRNFNANAVVLTHGITDNREGVAGYAELFLRHGYAVLLPDARAHGESGGEFATYGLKEADDLHRWASWLYSTIHRSAFTVLANPMAQP